MEYFAIASGVVLAVGFRVIALIWEFRDTFARSKHVELTAIRLDEPRPDGRAGHDTQSPHS